MSNKGLALLALVLLLALPTRTHGAGKQQSSKQRPQQKQHQPFDAFLGLLAASTAPSIAAYQAVHQYNYSLPLPLLKNGLVYRGSSARLRRVVSRLLQGEHVHIGAVGSSITYGRGVERGTSDWLTLFSSWLQAAFPAAVVSVRNGALPLATSEYLSACLDQLVEQQADLVFVEVTAADGYLDTSINNELVHAFERLVRKLLKLPHKPAVVVVNALNPAAAHTAGAKQQQKQGQQKPKQQPAKGVAQPGGTAKEGAKQQAAAKQPPPQQQQQQQQQGVPFYHTIEDHFGVVAQYYELPWLSLRNSVWQGLQHGWDGFQAQQLFAAAPHQAPQQQQQQQHHKQHHRQQQQQQQLKLEVGAPQNGTVRQLQQQPSYLPTALAHQYTADLAVSLLQQVYLQQLLRPLGPSDATAADTLRLPMFPGNWEGHGSGCAVGVDLRGAVRDEHKDWYFVNAGSTTHPRWGFVSHTPGTTLTLQLDSRSKGATRAFPQLTTAQKVQLLQRHKLFAAAAELMYAEGTKPPPPALPPPTAEQAAAAAANAQIWGGAGNGLGDATAEAERQAAAAAIQLRLGQVKPYVNSERIVGVNPYSTLQLPPEARLEVGKTQTATGVEVILPNKVGRRRLQQQQHQQDLEQQQQQQQWEVQESAAAAAAAAWAVAPAASSSRILSSSRVHSSSSSSSSRALTAAPSPLTIPPPHDAVYLKPSADGSSSSSAAGAANGTAAAVPGTVGASIFSEYSFRPQPSMLLLVGYLKGPRMMGRARISCLSGCSCKPVTVDGWHSSRHQQLATARVHVTQSPQCMVGVEVLPETSSGHHKFEVTGVMLAQSVHYRGPEGERAHQYVMHPELLKE